MAMRWGMGVQATGSLRSNIPKSMLKRYKGVIAPRGRIIPTRRESRSGLGGGEGIAPAGLRRPQRLVRVSGEYHTLETIQDHLKEKRMISIPAIADLGGKKDRDRG